MTHSGTSGLGDETAKTPRHPAIDHVLQYFVYDHLPGILKEVSKPFADLAREVANRSPSSQETTVARVLAESATSGEWQYRRIGTGLLSPFPVTDETVMVPVGQSPDDKDFKP